MEDLDAHFKMVGERALLTREEEVSLCNRIRNGDEMAREMMICANLKLVAKIAREYMGLGLPLPDLFQEGIIGLMVAVDKFDPSRGKFSTHCYWWIYQSITRALYNQGRLIRLPVHVLGKLFKLRRNGTSLHAELKEYQKEKPETEDHGLSEKQLDKLRAASQTEKLVWLDAPVGDDGDAVVGDYISAEMEDGAATELTDRLGLNGNLAKMVGNLSRNERIVLGMRFGLNGATPKTLDEIAPMLGVTKERVRQIERKCLRKLRKTITSTQKSTAE